MRNIDLCEILKRRISSQKRTRRSKTWFLAPSSPNTHPTRRYIRQSTLLPTASTKLLTICQLPWRRKFHLRHAHTRPNIRSRPNRRHHQLRPRTPVHQHFPRFRAQARTTDRNCIQPFHSAPIPCHQRERSMADNAINTDIASPKA